jgi:hypothetical protein
MSPRRPAKKPLISPAEWRLFWLISLVLALLTGAGTGLTLWLSRPEEPKNVLPSQSPFKAGVSDTIPKTILLSDFDLPAPGGQWLSKAWLYSRDGGSRPWTPEEIAPFWVPVDQIPLARLPQDNGARIEKMFEAVP